MERSEDVLLSGGGMNTNGDVNAVINPNTPSSNSSNSTQSNNASDRPNTSYSMPGILHFLQHEWNRFEFERQQWELDRAELMTKISFLQGERRGQENLKNNLLRRIKMLEVALRQERIKFHKLKFGSDLSPFNNAQADSKNNASSTSNDNELELK
ncbi:striatin-3 isoform X2 [Brachionus plicatilis]|uniref:Striatin-3 isoform X2 n=1 Tax=Brachionus plicatilis TaxID=10195 RepID=A0A3M7P1Q5_BRAPC|nr:striatin-3 isoform X2 [Brachionus plicatilis]